MKNELLPPYLKLEEAAPKLGEEFKPDFFLRMAAADELTLYFLAPHSAVKAIFNKNKICTDSIVKIGNQLIPLRKKQVTILMDNDWMTCYTSEQINQDEVEVIVPGQNLISGPKEHDERPCIEPAISFPYERFCYPIRQGDAIVKREDLLKLINPNQRSSESSEIGEINTLKALGLMAMLLAEKSAKYKNGSKPNAEAIKNAVNDLAIKLKIDEKGLVALHKKIATAVKALENEVE